MDFNETYHDTVSTTALAARGGHVDILKELIKSGRSVDVKDNRGWISLHEAAYHGHLECLDIILQHKQDEGFVDFRTFQEQTALMLACTAGHAGCVRRLLESGADVNARTLEDYSPLWEATVSSNLECVQLVVQAGADLERPIYTKDRALHHAAQMGYTDVLQCLLEAGADVTAQANSDLTPLILAAQFGKLESIRLLIDAAEKKGQEFKLHFVNLTADDNASALYLAVQEEYPDCVELLLSRGADPHLCVRFDAEPGHYMYPLQVAIDKENTRIVELLIKATDIERFDWPMFKSCRRMIGDLEKPPSASYQPLFMTMSSVDTSCLKLLIAHGYLKQYQKRVRKGTIGNIFQSVPLRLRCVVLLVKSCPEFIREQFTTGDWELYSAALFESPKKERNQILTVLLRTGAPCVGLLHRMRLLRSPTTTEAEQIVLLCKYMYRQTREICHTEEERSSCMEIIGPKNWEEVDMTLLVKLCLTSNILRVQQKLDTLLPNLKGQNSMPANAQEGVVERDIIWKLAEGFFEEQNRCVLHCKENFQTLQHMCRVNIVFKLLDANNFTKEAIQLLGLPTPLQNYILYTDMGIAGEKLVDAAEATVKTEKMVDKLFKEIEIDVIDK